jgi:hypothetical protein
MNKNKMMVAFALGIGPQIKESIKVWLVTIGVVATVALVSWAGHELMDIRAEVAKGISWMSSFM